MKQNRSILIVDDQIENIQVIQNCLEKLPIKFLIYRATNASTALQICLKKIPDIVITDWDMPEMSGIELVCELKNNASTKNIPVIMCTGVMLTSENLKTALDAGAFDYIRKPIDKVELEARLMSALRYSESLNTIKTECEQFLSLLDSIPGPIYVSDYETSEIIFANKAKFALYGEDIIGKKCYSVFHNLNSPCEFCTKLTLLNSENQVIPWQHHYKNINKHLYNIDKLIYWHNGKLAKFQIGFDISDLINAQNEIRKLSTAVEQSPVTIVITDLCGNIQFVNKKFTELTGYTFEEAIGKNPRVLKTPFTKAEVFTDLWKTITAGEVWNGEFINKTKHGDIFIEKATIAPIRDNEGNINNYVAIKENITEKKQMEEILVKSEKKLREANATKDKFFSIIAHDLKNPFNSIVGFSDLLLKNIDKYDKDKILNFVKNINNSSKQAFILLENLLLWARSQSGNIEFYPTKNNLKNIIQENILLAENQANNKEIQIENHITDDYFVFCDKNMINTVIRNLLTNAVKFTTNKGKITTAIKLIENNYEVTISDTGVGISPENIDKLFRIDSKHQTLGTADEKGTGLGLILCKEFIEKHKGKIWAESEKGKGSDFKFTLQIAL